MSAAAVRALGRRGVVVLAVLCLIAVLAPRPSVSGARAATATPRKTRFPLAPGVHLITIESPKGPNEIRVLALRQGAGALTDVLPATKRYPGYRKPSALAAEAAAIAAVNGDFASRNGRPQHLEMVDGELWSTGRQEGPVYAHSADGTRAYVGVPSPKIVIASPGLPGAEISKMNAGPPIGATIAAFSLRGGTLERPPGNVVPKHKDLRWCAARLVPTGPIGWSGAHRAMEARSYTVEDQPDPCPKTPEDLGAVSGSVVLAARAAGRGGTAIKALEPGSAVEMRWGLSGWPGVVDAIGATPMLVRRGVNVAPPYRPGGSYFYNDNPRTAVGITPGCEDAVPDTVCLTYIVTVDGRQTDTGWSRGLRLPNLAKVLIGLGVRDGMNLDGGGGTVMWVARTRFAYCQNAPPVGGCLVNRPSDRGGERNGVTSLAIIRGPDPGEPPGLLPRGAGG
jgi:Phosphodiester glycosidase